MNCFPCKGPACNSCKKFDRINAAVARSSTARCAACGGQVDLSQGICTECGMRVLASPGTPAGSLGGGHALYHEDSANPLS